MPQREIIFDTETTGFDPHTGDRIVEIGAIEVIDLLPTGKEFHSLVNPERDIPLESTRVHGITNDKVKDSPCWREVCGAFLDFIGNDSILIAHNARFDMNFIDFQLQELGFPPISEVRVKDSLALAKKKYPGQPNSLDALCRRFNIDLSVREDRHGALLDSYLLADVWLELHGGRQQSMHLLNDRVSKKQKTQQSENNFIRPARSFPLATSEEKIHHEFITKNIQNSLWYKNTNEKR